MRQKQPKIILLRPQWDTFEEVVDTEDEDNDGSDTIDPDDLQECVRDGLEVLATCMNIGENDAAISGVDNSLLETTCLKLAELPEALAIVKQAGEEPQTKTDTHVVFLAARAKLDNHLDENVCPTVRVISDTMTTDRLRSSEGSNEPGHSLSNAYVRICKQSLTNERHAAFVMRVVRPDIGQEILNAQVVLST